MKKYALIALLAGAAVLAGGCSSKKETEKATEKVAATEAAKEEKATEAAEAATEAADTEAAEAVTEAAEAVTEAAEAVTEAAEAVTEADKKTGSVEESTSEAADTQEAAPTERPEYKARDYVTLGEYTQLPIELDPIVVTDDEMLAAMSGAAKAADAFEEVKEGTVQVGDIANIDYEGKKDGVAFEGGTAQGYDLTIGSNTFIAGFESGLIGAKIGDTVDLNLTFPENYGAAELAGADVVFTVKINYVKRMPELTDALVSTISGGAYSTVDGYTNYVKEQIRAQKEASQESQIEQELMVQLHNTCQINEYPQALIDYSVSNAMDYYTSAADTYGMTLEELVQASFGMDLDTFKTTIADDAKASLQQEMILRAIAEQENLEVTDADYQSGCETYAAVMGYDSVDAFKEAYSDQVIRSSLLMDQALTFVRDNALIIEKELETESEMQPEEAATEATTEA